MVFAFASAARAADYEASTEHVERESDVTAMEARGELSASAAESLHELIHARIDLNRAGRDELYELPGLTESDVDAILLYREHHGHIDKASELVDHGVLSEAKLRGISAFVQLEKARVFPFGGSVRLLGAASNGDFLDPHGYQGPPLLFLGELQLPFNLSAGLMLETTRREPGSPSYDPLRNALVADGFDYRLALANAFVQWKGAQSRVVVGTYNIGFAERLTFDSTRRAQPEGITLSESFRRPMSASRECRLANDSLLSPCAPGERDVYVTPDFLVRQPLRGLAASIEDLDLGHARLSLYGWLSYQSRNIYQYEIVDRRTCADPRDERAPGCAAPDVFVVHGADLTRDSRLIFSTLPSLYDEALAGARATLKAFDRWRFGLTGFGAKNFWHGAPLELDTQDWSHVPFGGPFGAVGVDTRALFGDFTVALEATRSFDSIPPAPAGANPLTPNGGGGYGIEQRTVFSRKGDEAELSLRYYDNQFVNPYARPPSAPDELDGQHARNEAGVRAKYTGTLPLELKLSGRADFWVLPYGSPTGGPAGTMNLYALLRLTWARFDRFQPSIWFDLRNRNLASSAHGGCSSEYVPATTGDDTFDCSGDLYRVTARIDFIVDERWLEGAMQSYFTWRDDPRYRDRFREDVMAWLELRSHLTEWLHLRLRSKYLHEDISTDDYREESLWTWLELVVVPGRWLEAAARYDVYWFLDKRVSTLSRVPNPEHRFFLDVTWRF